MANFLKSISCVKTGEVEVESLAPHCEWRTLPGLGSDHLPIEIVLPLSPVRHPNTRPVTAVISFFYSALVFCSKIGNTA